MKFLFEKHSILFSFIAATILVVALFIYFVNSQKVKSTGDLMNHTEQVIRMNNNVLVDILNIETGSRGFIISGNNKFLEHYYAALTTINRNLTALARLTKDNPVQHLRIDSLIKLAAERLVFTNKTINSIMLKSLNENQKIATIEKGKNQTDNIRRLISSINAEEFNLLNQRKTANEESESNSLFIFLFLIVSIVVIFALVINNIRNQKIINKELEEITHSEKLLSQYSLSLIEASLDPLITISTEGKITDMNEALANITGLSREKLTGTNFYDYFTEPEMAREVYREIFAYGSVANSSLTIKHTGGKLTDVLFNGSVYRDEKGDVAGAVVVARDVAEQKWAKEINFINEKTNHNH